MSLTMIGKKRGMTRIYETKTGKAVPCTVIEVEPNVVSQLKNLDNDGYEAIQLAAIKVKKKSLTKPELGHLSTKKVEARRKLIETRTSTSTDYEIGQEIGVDIFEVGQFVDVSGKSKGKGYQGAIKRHGYSLVGRTHGTGPIHRHAGSAGFLTSHGEVPRGKKMAGHMGDKNVTVESLEVLKVDTSLNALVVKGAVPGANGSVVYMRKAKKK